MEIINQTFFIIIAATAVVATLAILPLYRFLRKKRKEKFIRSTGLFDELTDTQFKKIVEKFQEFSVPESTLLFSQGDPADSLYLIEEGRVRVFLPNKDGEEVLLALLGEGRYFGEQGILGVSSGFRNASIRTVQHTRLLKLSDDDFRSVILSELSVKNKLEKAGAIQLLQNLNKFLNHFEVNSNILEDLKIYDHSITMIEDQGVIIKEGDLADTVYYIISGKVGVYKKNKEGNQVLCNTLMSGNLLGEFAVIKNIERAATAKAIGPVNLLSISKENFLELYSKNIKFKNIFSTLKESYTINSYGQVNQYISSYNNLSCIVNNIISNEGQEFFSYILVGKYIQGIKSALENPDREIVYSNHGVIRILNLIKNKIIGVSSYGSWDEVGSFYQYVLHGKTITDEKIDEFYRYGTCVLDPISDDKNIVNDSLWADKSKIVCKCMSISEDQIMESIIGGCGSSKEVSDSTGAGLVCGSCIPAIDWMIGSKVWEIVKLKESIELTKKDRVFRFELADNKNIKPTKPGQYINLQTLINGQWIERSFTLINHQNQKLWYEIAVRNKKGGALSDYLFEHANYESVFRISRPQGDALLKTDTEEPIVCFAVGIGITLAVCFARFISDSQLKRKMDIYYSVDDRGTAPFYSELQELSKENDNIELHLNVDSEVGQLSENKIIEIIKKTKGAKYFISGPNRFEEMLSIILLKSYVNQDSIVIKNFNPSSK